METEEIFQLGIVGFERLVDLEPRMKKYRQTIFSPLSVNFERGLKSQEQIHVITKELDEILMFLSPHFLLESTHQVLEFLIRVYELVIDSLFIF
mgnify:CR=1 FL=1